jgi:hypothetical protein
LEQLEYLIEHAQGGVCGCAQCERYLRVRSVIMEVFADSPQSVLMNSVAYRNIEKTYCPGAGVSLVVVGEAI